MQQRRSVWRMRIGITCGVTALVLTSSGTVLAQDTTPPTVAITSPSPGATVSGTITVTATASDDVGVTGVRFRLNGNTLGTEATTAPYSVTWDTRTAINGSYALTARAKDAAGNRTTTSEVTVTVFNDTTPPTVAITSPASGATVSGTIAVSTTASDDVAVAGMQFLLDGAPLGAEVTTPPFALSWNSRTASNGLHTLTARARDAAGNSTTSSAVTVTLANDFTPPTVAITSPVSGATVFGTIAVSATASDNIGVAGVQFLLDGVPLGAEVTIPPFAISWDSKTASDGAHTLTAQARDTDGNRTSSLAVTVTVTNDRPPTVIIESPSSGATVFASIAVRATAFDDVGVVGVKFFVDGKIVGVEDVSWPYVALWNTIGFSDGAHTLTAVARDTAGNSATSNPVLVTVFNDVLPPTVAVASPSLGATVSGTVNVSASVSDNFGIMGVQFFLDGAPLGNDDPIPPYSTTWNTPNFANGSYTLSARATDSTGNVATSNPVTVTVSNPTSPAACATPLTPFPGVTNFNNTVRAQMWFVNNTWWGAFSDGSSGIYFYTLSGGTFVKGSKIDPAFTLSAAKLDTLWNGKELFIVVFKSGALATLYKYRLSSSGTSFRLFSGFPVNLPLAGFANAIALDQDSTGKLWATYTSGSNVHVIWSTSTDHLTWNTTGVIVEDNISAITTEAATIVPFGGNKIGVAWSNQQFGEYAFRFHVDGEPENIWSVRETVDCCNLAGSAADDHLSLRAAPDGRLFLVAKDSIAAGNIHFFIRSAVGTWSQRIKIDSDPLAQPTRPSLTLDVQNNDAYVLYHNSTDGHVYVARTPMDTPNFARCVMRAGGNNVTATKMNVNATTGLVAVASAGGQIIPGVIALRSTPAPAPGPAALASVAAAASLAEATSLSNTAAPPPAPSNETSAEDFHLIWNGQLSSSRAPASNSQWRWLREQGANTVVHLDGAMLDFAQFGFESFLWVPLRAGEAPTNEEAERFLRFIQLRENQPAHLSSAAVDARAVMVALARYAVDAWSIEDALAEGRRLSGAAGLSTRQTAWLLGWAAKHAPGSHRLRVGGPHGR